MALLLMVLTAVLLNTRGDADRVPPTAPLATLPEDFGGWTGRDLTIADDVLAVLGKGDFLSRLYTYTGGQTGGSPYQGVSASAMPASGGDQSVLGRAPVGLFIGYFPTQRSGQSIHSPQNCLPGAGWTFQSSRYVYLTAEDQRRYHVGEYVISDGTTRQFVIYWYQAHGRSVANEYLAKYYLIADAIRLNRTDGALVRVTTVVTNGETVDQARERAIRFTSRLAPMLPRFLPD